MIEMERLWSIESFILKAFIMISFTKVKIFALKQIICHLGPVKCSGYILSIWISAKFSQEFNRQKKSVTRIAYFSLAMVEFAQFKPYLGFKISMITTLYSRLSSILCSSVVLSLTDDRMM